MVPRSALSDNLPLPAGTSDRDIVSTTQAQFVSVSPQLHHRQEHIGRSTNNAVTQGVATQSTVQ